MNLLTRFLPSQPKTGSREIVRAGIGACLGIAVTGAVSTLWLDSPGGAPLLIAPIGASTVLLFAIPASPLAQPFAILGGNILAALIGVTMAHWVPAPIVAAALAVSLAIMAMALCRCIHPPSGAVALTAVLGGPKILAAGYQFVAIPVLLNSVLLVIMALLWNKLTGRSYPHRAHPVVHPPAFPVATPLPLSAYEAVIADYGETLTIGAEDLRELHEALLWQKA
jgi:CBS domain-containing membrane protein